MELFLQVVKASESGMVSLLGERMSTETVQETNCPASHETARYNPSIATPACQMPNLRTARSTAGAGSTSTNATGTTTSSEHVSASVILGLMTRK